jgi:acid phosphatase type 7
MKHFRIIFLSFLLIFCAHGLQAQQNANDSVVVVFGDTRTNHEVHRAIVKEIMKWKPIAVFHTGDLVFNGKKHSAWMLFKEITKPIIDSSRFYPSFGNHERHSRMMDETLSVPNNGKWYSVDINKVHYTVIDNYSDYSPGSEQYKWLVNDLETSANSSFRVVIMHLPVYSSGLHRTSIKKLKKTLVPLFEKYKVAAVFSGHNHCYEKAFANNVFYITTAGGGAPLYPKTKDLPQSQLYIKAYNYCTLKVKNNILLVQAWDIDRKVLDEIVITK